jgi:hypothetical protein
MRIDSWHRKKRRIRRKSWRSFWIISSSWIRCRRCWCWTFSRRIRMSSLRSLRTSLLRNLRRIRIRLWRIAWLLIRILKKRRITGMSTRSWRRKRRYSVRRIALTVRMSSRILRCTSCVVTATMNSACTKNLYRGRRNARNAPRKRNPFSSERMASISSQAIPRHSLKTSTRKKINLTQLLLI